MNKKNNRKGFTIVELVIVIAVIAILATVLVPTFSGIVTRAQDTAAIQEARNIYTQYVAENAQTGDIKDTILVKTANGKYVQVTEGAVANAPTTGAPTDCTAVLSMNAGVPTVTYEGTTHGWADGAAAGTKCPTCGTAKP